MAVYAAVGQQADEVQGAVVLLSVLHSGQECLVLKEGAVLDGLGDAGELLVHNAAGAHVGVAHFAVAHLSVGQAHIQAGSADLGHRLEANRASILGFLAAAMALPLFGSTAKAIQNHQNERFFHGNRSFLSVFRERPGESKYKGRSQSIPSCASPRFLLRGQGVLL